MKPFKKNRTGRPYYGLPVLFFYWFQAGRQTYLLCQHLDSAQNKLFRQGAHLFRRLFPVSYTHLQCDDKQRPFWLGKKRDRLHPHPLDVYKRQVVDDLIAEYDLNGIALRCWNEFQLEFGIAPCMVLGELNERGIAASCEVDITNTLMMQALALAGNTPSMLLDINNNYRDDPDKCILFHCGPVPISLMEGKGTTIEHKMFVKSLSLIHI